MDTLYVCIPTFIWYILLLSVHLIIKVKKVFVYFDSAWRLGFYFDCIHQVIGWKGHIIPHKRGVQYI